MIVPRVIGRLLQETNVPAESVTHFCMPGTLAIWGEPFVATRIPYLYNLRTDPYERADITSLWSPKIDSP